MMARSSARSGLFFLRFTSIALLTALTACGPKDEEAPRDDGADMSVDVTMDMGTSSGDMGGMEEMGATAPPLVFEQTSWPGAKLLDTAWGRIAAEDVEGPLALIVTDQRLELVSAARTVTLSEGVAVKEGSLAGRQVGPICAAWVVDATVSVACGPDFSAPVTHEVDGEGYHLSVTEASMTLWYKQGASAHSLVRMGEGAFEEVELYESSVSYFGDAVTYDSGEELSTPVAVGCLIDSGSSASFEGLSEQRFGSDVTRCVFSANGARLSALAANTTRASVVAHDGSVSAMDLSLRGARAVADFGDEVVLLSVVDGRLSAAKVNAQGELSGGVLTAWAEVSEVSEVGAFAAGDELLAIVQGSVGEESGVHVLRVSRADLPQQAFGSDAPFEALELPTPVYGAAAMAPAGEVFAITNDRLYRALPGQMPQELGRLERGGGTPSLLAVSGERALYLSNSGSSEQMQLFWDGAIEPVISEEVVGNGTRAFGGELYVMRSAPQDVAPCVERVDGPSTFTRLGCFPEGRDVYGSSSGLVAIVFGFDGEPVSYMLRDGRIVNQAEEVSASSLTTTGYIERAQQAEDGSLWVVESRRFQVHGSAGWKAVALPEGAGLLAKYHAVSESLAWMTDSTHRVYRYDGASWSEVELGFSPVRLDALGGSREHGLMIVADTVVYRER